MSSSLFTLDDIPTVSELYQEGDYQASSSSTVTPSQRLNDAVGVIRADITKLVVGAIVNAANKSCLGGGGVDGAIHRAAGRGLLKECKKLGGCNTGSAKITNAYDLPCEKVIHAVGPIYGHPQNNGKDEELLRGCYRKALELAVENNLRSIAFSSLSTGVYGYPSKEAAEAALSEAKLFLQGKDGDKLDKVIFTVYELKDVNAYKNAIPEIFPATEKDLKSGNDNEVETAEITEASKDKGKAPAVEIEEEETEASKEAGSIAVKLPDVPTTAPKEDGEPDNKKVKLSHGAEDDWEEVDRDVESAPNGPAVEETQGPTSAS